jgi:ubiquinone/menaquinone biosynthesis C-methylase UbiE
VDVRQSVADQYDLFPYPQRRPYDERTRLISGELGELALVKSIYYSGHCAFDDEFRVLDVGCGTGDAAIFMAEQQRDTGARVTGVDLSEASLAVARARTCAAWTTSTSNRRRWKTYPSRAWVPSIGSPASRCRTIWSRRRPG